MHYVVNQYQHLLKYIKKYTEEEAIERLEELLRDYEIDDRFALIRKSRLHWIIVDRVTERVLGQLKIVGS